MGIYSEVNKDSNADKRTYILQFLHKAIHGEQLTHESEYVTEYKL